MKNSLFKKLASIPTATIAAGQNDSGIIDPAIRPMWSPINLVGVAFTIESISGDNSIVHQAISEAPIGSVIVLNTKYHKEHACVGDIIIRNCIKNELAGFVTNGVMRDLNDCRNLGLPIYATGVCMRGPIKGNDGGIILEKVLFGGVEIQNGDYIIGDDDGLVVVKHKNIKLILDRAYEKEKNEKEVIKRINSGENTKDIFRLD